jgi:hypothetical protein
MKRLLLAGLIFHSLSTLFVRAQSVQPFQVQWYTTFGGTNADFADRIAVAPDGGYLVAAFSYSAISGSKQTTNYGGRDCWLVRLDRRGSKLWERNLGGPLGDRFRDLRLTRNGEWILVGESGSSPSSGNKNSPLYGESDYWVMRLDDQSNTLWEKSYGGTGYDEAVAVTETEDGALIVAGYSYSPTNEIKTIPSIGMSDTWILRLSAQGDILWQTNYGAASQNWPFAIDRYGTNGFVIAAASSEPNDVWGSADFWIFAIDQDGKKLWEGFYGGDGTDEPLDIQQTSDGGFITCGWMSDDFGIVRLNSAGEKVWERTLGQEGVDIAYGLLQTLDGGFVLTGTSFWTNAWTVRLDTNGNLVWQHSFNVGLQTSIMDIQNTADGGLIAVGTVASNGPHDVFVMKLAPDSLTAPLLEIMRHAQESGTLPTRILLRGIAGRTYVAERTEDFLNWLPFATNTLSSDSVELLDQPPTSASRFYRATIVPP